MNSDAADDSPAGARASADFVADWDIGADLLAHIDVAGDLLVDSGVCDGPLIELLNDSHATADLTAPCSLNYQIIIKFSSPNADAQMINYII